MPPLFLARKLLSFYFKFRLKFTSWLPEKKYIFSIYGVGWAARVWPSGVRVSIDRVPGAIFLKMALKEPIYSKFKTLRIKEFFIKFVSVDMGL